MATERSARVDPSPASQSEAYRLADAVLPVVREFERRAIRGREPFCACHPEAPFDCPDQAWFANRLTSVSTNAAISPSTFAMLLSDMDLEF